MVSVGDSSDMVWVTVVSDGDSSDYGVGDSSDMVWVTVVSDGDSTDLCG